MKPTHADWELIRSRRDNAGHELALAVRDGATEEAKTIADRVIALSEEMTRLNLEIDES